MYFSFSCSRGVKKHYVPNDPEYNEVSINSFMKNLKLAITNNDIASIDEMIRFPLKTYVAGKTVYIKNKKQFRKNYEFIFNKYIRNVINRYPSEENGFGPQSGVLINGGAINLYIVGHYPDKYKIWYINNKLYKLFKGEEIYLK